MSDIINLTNISYLGIGALISILIAVCGLIFGTLFGIIGAVGKLSKKKLPKFLATVYVEVFRGTPMLLQILFIYLAIPVIFQAITSIRISPSPLLMGIIAISINSGAYATELIRSGIQSIEKGQTEAARSLGLSQSQTLRHIILPQAFKRIVPPMVSEFIVLVKDSSLVSVIGVYDLMKRARAIGATSYDVITPLIMAAVMYLMLTLTISYFARRLERRLQESD